MLSPIHQGHWSEAEKQVTKRLSARFRISVPVALQIVIMICSPLNSRAIAQGYNFNIGSGPGFPVYPTSSFAHTSYNFVTGGGVNPAGHIKINAEFMFHGLPVQHSIIQQSGFSDVKGRLYSLTGNVLVGTGASKSVYLIGGGGWYRRTLEAKQTVLVAGTACVPAWASWSIPCANGVVSEDMTVGSRTTSAPGFNVGGGFTFRLGDSSANFFTEIRYHHAFTKSVETTILPLTFGIRW